ncbi:MAG: hypothetical protein EHM41_00180 [Chloroflexi bacterium]|nr:MAG: hypothetical protein EHM41_00180 [Chloroflexota bacterium]
MSEEVKAISLNPDDFVAGGLIDDIIAKLQHSFVMYDYEGKADAPAPCLKLEMVDNESGEEYPVQYLSAGSAQNWVPSDDAKTLVPVGSKTAMTKNSNLAIYLTEMINAGFPKNQLTTSIACLDGVVAHMIRKELPKRGNVSQTQTGKDGKEYAKSILVPDRIVKLPGEKAGAVKGKKTAATDDAVKEAATTFVLELLGEKNGKFQKKEIPAALVKVPVAVRPQVMAMVYANDKFLSEGGGGLWTYANGEVKSVG